MFMENRSLAYVRFRRGELAEALQLCDEAIGLTAGREPRMTRLLMGGRRERRQ